MSWKLQFIEDLEEYKKQGNRVTPGCCWLAPWLIDRAESWFAMSLSPEYKRDWADKRPPLIIRLPNGDDWQPDARFGSGDDKMGLKEHGWVITGEIPNITAMPSVNSIRTEREWGYHGWLKDGVLSDDLEGRTYEWVMPPTTKQVMDFIMSGKAQPADGSCEYQGFIFKRYTPEHPDDCYIMSGMVEGGFKMMWDSQRGGSWFGTATVTERKIIWAILNGQR